MEGTSILESDLLMLSLRPRLMLMLILHFFMVLMDMACHMLAMLDTDMVPMVMVLDPMDMAEEDSLILERGPLMPSLRPRLMLMLILLFSMVLMDMACHMLDMLDMDWVPMAMVLELMAMGFPLDMLIWDKNNII